MCRSDRMNSAEITIVKGKKIAVEIPLRPLFFKRGVGGIFKNIHAKAANYMSIY